ncbi:MraY family glycosyltransferase [Robertmurraya massiliosenegalensis]|uniref:MraY family glycosyltransferase n=1 Tax=Robertmurraya massiliosenegalensis TaxID=1287657 RepID=UPI0002E3FCFE|nr:MraY family glycosyltransferase [Robertmurraya massiliosenegalensis]
MYSIIDLVIAFTISLISTLLLVYPIKKLALRWNIIDLPNYRKVHKTPTARLGGLAIFFGTCLGIVYLSPSHEYFLEMSIGAVIIVLTGLLDDKFQIRPVLKLTGQLIPATILILSGLIIDRITLPFYGVVDLSGPISVIITLFWIVGITNAINLIDGLDGLASGVSTIALISILTMAILDNQILVIFLAVTLIGSNLGFLFHNFHPAKIYMGDTGSLFLGYMIAVISILGLFKNVTLFSFIIPIIILAVPIFDTIFAIIRRVMNGKKIMMPDKKHFHHQLLAAGFSHRTTVIIIYGFSTFFGGMAIIFSNASIGYSLIIAIVIWFMLHIIAEFVGLVGKGKRPVIRLMRKLFGEVRSKKQHS